VGDLDIDGKITLTWVLEKWGVHGSIVVKALCYKLEGCRFYLILSAALGPGVYSGSNRNEYQKQTNNVSGE
jgi:hypothetical protein